MTQNAELDACISLRSNTSCIVTIARMRSRSDDGDNTSIVASRLHNILVFITRSVVFIVIPVFIFAYCYTSFQNKSSEHLERIHHFFRDTTAAADVRLRSARNSTSLT